MPEYDATISYRPILTETQVRQIRKDYASGMQQREIAKKHGVHFVTISDIIRGVSWRHVT